jgi:hypothetical protein
MPAIGYTSTIRKVCWAYCFGTSSDGRRYGNASSFEKNGSTFIWKFVGTCPS